MPCQVTWNTGLLAVGLLLAAAVHAGGLPPDYADGLAGGPDYWSVTNLPPDGVLNVRAGAGPGHTVTGSLGDAELARNLGCRLAGTERWCRVKALADPAVEGWVNGIYLREAAVPAQATRQVIRGAAGEPDLVVRATGDIEVIFPQGCMALYDSGGTRITAGATCGAGELAQSQALVLRYLQDPAAASSTVPVPQAP